MKEDSGIIPIEATEAEVIDAIEPVNLSKTYEFEGKEITQIDLTGLEDVTATDLIKASAYTRRKGVTATMPETTLEFCIFVAAQVAGLPIEFFERLKARDALKVKNAVFAFFYGGD